MVAALHMGAALFALLFLAAGWGKLDDRRSWSVTASTLVPMGRLAYRFLRTGLPVMEIILGVAIFVHPVGGMISASGVLLCFALAVVFLSRQRSGQSCNCFGALSQSQFSIKLGVRNLSLSFIAGGIAWMGANVGLPSFSPEEVIVTVPVMILSLAIAEWRRFSPLRIALPTMEEA